MRGKETYLKNIKLKHPPQYAKKLYLEGLIILAPSF